MTAAGVLLHMRIKTIFSHVIAAFASSPDFIHLLFKIPSCFFMNSCIYQLFLWVFFAFAGHGKNHKDAASVRATYPIPAACGIYYFEVKIVSKGRDGSVHVASSNIFCLHAVLDKFIRSQTSVRCLYNKCVLNLHAVMVCCITQHPNIVFLSNISMCKKAYISIYLPHKQPSKF